MTDNNPLVAHNLWFFASGQYNVANMNNLPGATCDASSEHNAVSYICENAFDGK